VRDKDSCGSILLACEIAAWCKANGSSVFQYMIEIYKDLGMYYEGLITVVQKGREGAIEIEQMMKNYRENPPLEIAGSPVEEIKDVKAETCLVVSSGSTKVMDDIPKSNVLIYYTQEGTKVCVRPSGTEPKIKFYVSVKDTFSSEAEFSKKLDILSEKIDSVKTALNL